MSKPKRFYKTVTWDESGVLLDGKPVKTKSGKPLVHPSERLMQAVAQEWDACEKEIDYTGMPMTRLLMATLELDAEKRQKLVEHMLSYAGTDLLCYHAPDDEVLATRQREGWGPWLAWLKETCGAELHCTAGMMPIEQAPETISALQAQLETYSDDRLVAMNELTVLLGSVVLACAVVEHALDIEQAFALSVLDEVRQAERWGEDEEAMQARAVKQQECMATSAFCAHIN